jgi:UDP-N-acetylglucosamine 2-epimerase
MYESHFGITGLPFQLSPDPTFYFDSKSHHRALDELRRGMAERNGLIVLSGDIGAGKTTLMRAFTAELDPVGVALAQIVSTQLRPEELLRATLSAFGVPSNDGLSLDELRQRLLRFLQSLACEGRSAVLIVDEAQNLDAEAMRLLGTLATLEASAGVPLQVCAVGQPELRNRLDAGALADIPDCIAVACRVGPLEGAETGSYVEHRLHKVGWRNRPAFEPLAFDEVFRCTAGIPRRINLLCNRLMLTAFLAADDRIDAAAVARAAADLSAELDGAPVAPLRGVPSAVSPMAPPARPLHDVAAIPVLLQPVVEPSAEVLLCVAAGAAQQAKFAPLLRAFAARADLPPAQLLQVYADTPGSQQGRFCAPVGDHVVRYALDITEDALSAPTAEIIRRFEAVLDRCHAAAVIVMDGGASALTCAIAAGKRGTPVVHVNAGLRAGAPVAADDVTRTLLDHLAAVLYTSDARSAETLALEGMPSERIRFAGSVLVDALQLASQVRPHEPLPPPAPPQLRAEHRGYGLVVLDRALNIEEREHLAALLSVLKEVSRDVPLLWPASSRIRSRLDQYKLAPSLAGHRIICPPPQDGFDWIGAIGECTCVLTDCWDLQEATTALGVPCLTLGQYPPQAATVERGTNVAVGYDSRLATRRIWDVVFNGGTRGSLPDRWDGQASTRIAAHLAQWLQQDARGTSRGVGAASALMT